MDKKMHDKGLEVRKAVLGEAYVANAMKNVDAFIAYQKGLQLYDLAHSDPARDLLQRVFGYPDFRGPQAAIVEQLLSGGDALVLMPTGGGKSLCYQVPAIVRHRAARRRSL